MDGLHHLEPVSCVQGHVPGIRRLEVGRRRRGVADVELALQQSEELQRGILESSTDGMLLVTPEGVVRSFNRAATELFCDGGQELVGRPISTLIPALRIEGVTSDSTDRGGEDLALEAVRRMAELFAIEREANGRPAAERLAVRSLRSAPIVAALDVNKL